MGLQRSSEQGTLLVVGELSGVVISGRGVRIAVDEGVEAMTNTRFPGRPGWRAGRGNGAHRTKVRHDDVIAPAFPSASAASEGILGTARVRERLGHFRNTYGFSSDEVSE